MTMTLPPRTPTDDAPATTPNYDRLDQAIAELAELQQRVQRAMAVRDTELRRLRQQGVPVSTLRERTKLSKSMIRLLTTAPREAE